MPDKLADVNAFQSLAQELAARPVFSLLLAVVLAVPFILWAGSAMSAFLKPRSWAWRITLLAALTWITLLLAVVRIELQPTYFSQAKVRLAGGSFNGDSALAKAMFPASIIQCLKSPELMQLAEKRAHDLHPNLKSAKIEVHVSSRPDSAILMVTAKGQEPKSTQIYLGALLDEFFTYWQSLRERGLSQYMESFSRNVDRVTAAIAESMKTLEAYDAKHGIKRLAARQIEIKARLEEIDQGRPSADENSRKNLQKELGELAALLAEHKHLEDDYQMKKKAYDYVVSMMDSHRMCLGSPISGNSPDLVALQERASEAYLDGSKFRIPLWRLWTREAL